MVAAHSTYANKGVYIKPIFITRIEDKNGNVIEQTPIQSHEVMDEETAYLMLNLMEGVTQYGSGCSLRGGKYNLTQHIAGKTGTTDNQSDGWFIGSTPDLVAGVWVGCDDRCVHFRGLNLGQGAHTALPIWGLFMKQVYADPKIKISQAPFDRPAKLSVDIDCKNRKGQAPAAQYDSFDSSQY